MKKAIPFLVLLLTIFSSLHSQTPVVIYNSSGGNLNIRATPSTSGTFLCTIGPNKRLVTTGVTSTNWYEVYIPINGTGSPIKAWVSSGTGYMLPDNNADQVMLTASNVLIRKTAGGTGNMGTLWAYYPGYSYESAATASGQRYYPTGNTQSVSGTTWYEIDVPRGCYQCNSGSCSVASDFSITTLGWISGQYLSYITPCSYSISPSSQNFTATGGNGSFSVNAGSGCSWSATESCSWVTMNNSSGSGSGTASFTVSANTGATQRTCTVTVNGEDFEITQDGQPVCNYSLSPSSQNFTATGGNGSFTVNTNSGCAWSATESCAWVTMNNSSGSGPGTASFTVSANTTTATRTCTITVEGEDFEITQDGIVCTYSLSPSSQSFTASGGNGSFSVTVGAGCAWTATESCAWVNMTSSSGTGNGTVSFAVNANTTTSTRSCIITVNGENFEITQGPAVSCSYALSPSSQNFTATGGNGSFSVSADPGCTWTAAESCAWVTINSSGTGNGTASFTVTANTGVQRTCTISVNGEDFIVTQDGVGPPCTYTLSPSSQNFASTAGAGSFTVNTGSTCTWTATTSCGWVTMNNASGTSNGTASFTLIANTDSNSRTCSISVNGQTYVITQAGTTSPTLVADFYASQTSGCAPLTVNFFDNSTGSPSTFIWDFFNGATPSTSTSQNPTVVYNAQGTYTVKLTVYNGGNSDVMVKTGYITIPCFTAIEENSVMNSISIVPNPSSGHFTLSLETDITGPVQIKVFDAIGKLISNDEPIISKGINTQQINLQGAAKGIYFLQIKVGDKWANKKIEIH